MAKKMSKDVEEAWGIALCFIVVVIFGVIIASIIFWYIALPALVIIIGIIVGIYKSKNYKEKNLYKNRVGKAYRSGQGINRLWILVRDYEKMCEEFNKTTFTEEEIFILFQ